MGTEYFEEEGGRYTAAMFKRPRRVRTFSNQTFSCVDGRCYWHLGHLQEIGINESNAATGNVVFTKTVQYLKPFRRDVLCYCSWLAGLHPSLGSHEKIDAAVSNDIM